MELHDPLAYPQVVAYQEAVEEIQRLLKDNGDLSQMKMRLILLPSMLACVSEWHLENIPKKPTSKTFPATPIIDAVVLWEWLQGEILALLIATETIPNE